MKTHSSAAGVRATHVFSPVRSRVRARLCLVLAIATSTPRGCHVANTWHVGPTSAMGGGCLITAGHVAATDMLELQVQVRGLDFTGLRWQGLQGARPKASRRTRLSQ
ncbi:hypothetical protein Tco_1054228 [Tanacetum coccineum]|uniref:Secreted protein n=1 Tax=Tanacetum coccineum TaxID=301880 RepID=A0ABQ5GXE6_9ASTR